VPTRLLRAPVHHQYYRTVNNTSGGTIFSAIFANRFTARRQTCNASECTTESGGSNASRERVQSSGCHSLEPASVAAVHEW
jgi:hypothetical protein